MERVGNVRAEEKSPLEGPGLLEEEHVLDNVQEVRKNDALALAYVGINAGPEKVPNEPVLDGSVGPCFGHEAPQREDLLPWQRSTHHRGW